MSGFGSSILSEAAPPRLPACLIRNAGWLYSGFVAVTSRTADAESSLPSFDVIEIVAIFPPVTQRIVLGGEQRVFFRVDMLLFLDARYDALTQGVFRLRE